MIRISDKTLFWLTLLMIGLLYFIYLPVSYDFDGTVFSQFLRYAILENNLSPVIQSHHLFYFPLNFVAYKTLNFLTGYQVLEYFHLQLFSLVFALLTLIMSYRILKKIIPDRFFPVLGVWAIALSSVFWIYAVEAEVHMAGLFFIVAGIYLLFFNPPTFKNIVLSSLFLALSSGFHLTNGLIGFSVLFYFIHERRSLASILQYYFFYALFIAVPYLIYALFSHQDLVRHFLNILFGENMFSGYRINRWEGFSIRGVLNSVEAIGAGILVPSSEWLVILAVVIFGGIVFMALFVERTPPYRRVLRQIGFWVIPFFLFFCFWESRNIEFKLGMVTAILILAVFLLSRLRNKKLGNFVLIGFIVILFLANFFGSIKPRNDINSNRNYLLARAIGDNTPSNSSIYIAGSGSNSYNYGKIYIPYFGLRNVVILDWKLGKGRTFDLLREDLFHSLNRGEPVYFLSEITSLSSIVRDLMKKHELNPSAYSAFLNRIVFSDPVPLVGQYSLRQVSGLRPDSISD